MLHWLWITTSSEVGSLFIFSIFKQQKEFKSLLCTYSKMMKQGMRMFASHRSSNKSLKLIHQHSNEILLISISFWTGRESDAKKNYQPDRLPSRSGYSTRCTCSVFCIIYYLLFAYSTLLDSQRMKKTYE